MSDKPFGHRKVERDGIAAERGAIYHGGVLEASADGAANVQVFDGLDTSGDLIDYFYAATGRRSRSIFERGIDIRAGIYVDIGDNVQNFTIYYEPPSGDER
jgi:hypothetical protein